VSIPIKNYQRPLDISASVVIEWTLRSQGLSTFIRHIYYHLWVH